MGHSSRPPAPWRRFPICDRSPLKSAISNLPSLPLPSLSVRPGAHDASRPRLPTTRLEALSYPIPPTPSRICPGSAGEALRPPCIVGETRLPQTQTCARVGGADAGGSWESWSGLPACPPACPPAVGRGAWLCAHCADEARIHPATRAGPPTVRTQMCHHLQPNPILHPAGMASRAPYRSLSSCHPARSAGSHQRGNPSPPRGTRVPPPSLSRPLHPQPPPASVREAPGRH
jgi:hypothetical protein